MREDFPEQFEERCKVQDELGEGSWFPLRDLPEGEARRNEALPSCSFFCEMAEAEISATG